MEQFRNLWKTNSNEFRLGSLRRRFDLAKYGLSALGRTDVRVEDLKSEDERVIKYLELLEEKEIDLEQLRATLLQYESPLPLRTEIWMLLLGYLPPDKEQWDRVMNESRAQYWDMVQKTFPLTRCKVEDEKRRKNRERMKAKRKARESLDDEQFILLDTQEGVARPVVVSRDTHTVQEDLPSTSGNTSSDDGVGAVVDKQKENNEEDEDLDEEEGENEMMYLEKWKDEAEKLLSAKDQEVLNQVRVDVYRTSQAECKELFTHPEIQELLGRISFLWSKHHEDVGYFQVIESKLGCLFFFFSLFRL